jgi:Bacterial Tetracyclin repressor,  C-terminal domain
LTAALEWFLTIGASDQFVRLLLGDDGTGGLLPLPTTRAPRSWIGPTGASPMRSAPAALRPRPADMDTLADTVARPAISHVAAPGDAPARTTRIAALLAP